MAASPTNSMPMHTTSFRPSMRDALSACAVAAPGLVFSLSTSAGPQTALDNGDLCAYPSKPCTNAKATKLNGERHNFCEFHRRKANMNQRRWQQRRRQTRRGRSVTASTLPALFVTPSYSPERVEHDEYTSSASSAPWPLPTSPPQQLQQRLPNAFPLLATALPPPRLPLPLPPMTAMAPLLPPSSSASASAASSYRPSASSPVFSTTI